MSAIKQSAPAGCISIKCLLPICLSLSTHPQVHALGTSQSPVAMCLIHAPAGFATNIILEGVHHLLCFNHPRCDRFEGINPPVYVSIHAPQRCDIAFATCFRISRGFNPRTRRCISAVLLAITSCFNPRTRRCDLQPGALSSGGDSQPRTRRCDFPCPSKVAGNNVLIHAPAGATSTTVTLSLVSLFSIHAPARGATAHGIYHCKSRA